MNCPNLTFGNIAYDALSREKDETLKAFFEDVEEYALYALPDSRERALILTQIEVAYMWVGKAIRNEQISRERMNIANKPERSE